MPARPTGICKLTGEAGPFMKAHIIPEALTRHEVPGQPIFQAGEGTRPSKRKTSWYDPNIVTAKGESILSKYDNFGIELLRRRKLVWSGWTGKHLKLRDHVAITAEWGVRIIDNEDWDRFRLFLLSILWRAAISERQEFQEIIIPKADMEDLKEALISEVPPLTRLYPASLIQLSTKGPRHNQSPIAVTKTTPPVGPKLAQNHRFFRFFVEGLIVHFEINMTSAAASGLGKMAVGADAELAVLTRPYEGSFQAENLGQTMLDTWIAWPQMRPHILRSMHHSR